MAGNIEPTTGYVVDLGMIRDIANDVIVSKTDHRNFNIDVPYMKGTNPTTENIVVAIWRELKPALEPSQLVRLKLWETENNYVEFDGTGA